MGLAPDCLLIPWAMRGPDRQGISDRQRPDGLFTEDDGASKPEASGLVNRWPRITESGPSTCRYQRKRPVSWVFPASWAVFLVSHCGSSCVAVRPCIAVVTDAWRTGSGQNKRFNQPLAVTDGIFATAVPGSRVLIVDQHGCMNQGWTDEQFSAQLDPRFNEALRRAGIGARREYNIAATSLDGVARDPLRVPWGIYPLHPVACARLIGDVAVFMVETSGLALVQQAPGLGHRGPLGAVPEHRRRAGSRRGGDGDGGRDQDPDRGEGAGEQADLADAALRTGPLPHRADRPRSCGPPGPAPLGRPGDVRPPVAALPR